MAVLWGDVSDSVITEVDKAMAGKIKITIREFLSDPSRYAKMANILNTAANMREAVDTYVDGAMAQMGPQLDALDNASKKADALTGQLSQNISMQTKQYKVPLIKPVMVDRDLSKEETVYFDMVDTGVIALVERLCANAVYVADYTISYKNYKIGEWLFSGSKNYVLRAYLPPNDALNLQAAKEELDGLFDTSVAFLKEIL